MRRAADQSLKFNYVANCIPSRPVGFHNVLFCLFLNKFLFQIIVATNLD